MNVKVFEKFEPNNERGAVKSCEICAKQFSFINNREHQCKRCFRAVCVDCGKTKREVYKIGMIKQAHRLCDICTKQSDFLKQYIGCNQLKYGENSSIATKWLKKIPVDNDDQVVRSNSSRQPAKLTFQIFSQVWDAYNFSLRQFIGLLTFMKNQKDIYVLVNTVYEQLIEHGFQQKMENIVFLIIFLLAFSDPGTCTKIIDNLLRMKQTVTDGKQLFQSYLKAVGISDSDIKKLSDYLNFKLKQFISTFSVNILSVECSIHLLSRVMEKNKIQHVYSLFAIVVQDNLAFLLKNKNSKMDCDLELVRNSKLEKYLQKYRLTGNIKTEQFITSKGKSSPQQDKIQSSLPENKMYKNSRNQDDNLSNKTISLRDQLSFKEINNDDSFTRKTQKPLIIYQSGQSSNLQFTNFGSTHQCFECQRKNKKIEELQAMIKQKQKQLQNLNFKFKMTRKQSMNTDSIRLRNTTINKMKESEEVSKLERQMIKKSQQTDNYREQFNRLQRENISLSSIIQQLQMSNKMLKNRIQSSKFSQYGTTKEVDKDIEQHKVVQMLKKALQGKNKQLEQLMKKNKLINYQMEEMQREHFAEKPKPIQISDQELKNKLQTLSILLAEEQDQKIRVTNELFDLKQSLKEGQINKKGKQDCQVF